MIRIGLTTFPAFYTYGLVFNKWNDNFTFFLKKYIYTVNHKRIALNYLYFSIWSGLTGLSLATMIRLELAVPGSHFFKGDSLKYLQTATSHGLIMVFFVVIPVIFGFFANFFIPYHIGAKDVAFPRLNSFGFWVLFLGYITTARIAFFRKSMYNYYDNYENYFLVLKNYKKTRNLVPEFFEFSSTFYTNYEQMKYNNALPYIEFTKAEDVIKNETLLPSTPIELAPESLINSLMIAFRNKFTPFTNEASNIFSKSLVYGSLGSRNWGSRRKNISKVICNNAANVTTGWTFITPFSSQTKYAGFGAQDIAVLGVILAGISTTISYTNLLITRRTLSMPGLKNKKSLIPFLSISLFLTMRMLALITPVLGAAMIMLELDRHWKTTFFDYTYGGDPTLFQHLFWFFGHPEVYVVIIPGFGIMNMILPNAAFRRISSKSHLIWATYIMAYMGFLVWGHHMYLVGLDRKARAFFSTITIMISLPAVVKIVNWTLTMVNSTIIITPSLLFAFSFMAFFLSGGVTGMWLSHIGLNVYVHDTYYVVAHFHFMFSAATFSAVFCGLYFYYFNIFGVRYSNFLAYLHWFYWNLGQWLTFMPLYYVGYNGMPRRYHDYPLVFMGWHSLSSLGHVINICSIFLFFITLFESKLMKGKFVHPNLGVPRLNKRITYYLYKISNIQQKNKASLMNYKLFSRNFY